MAPEVLRCSPYNEKSDIFSIGCILHMMLTGSPPKRLENGTYVNNKIRLRYVSEEMRALIDWLTKPEPEDRPSIEEVARLPIMQTWNRLQETSARLDAKMIDKMYAYSTFPLLKKAALMAMVSRAESDADFLPYIEMFMSFSSFRAMSHAIDSQDIYEAMLAELSTEMEWQLKQTIRCGGFHSCRGRNRLRARRRGRLLAGGTAAERFKEELRTHVDNLARKMDSDGNGNLGYSEWLAATADERWYTEPERIAAVFRLFDTDADGMISEDDLKKVIPALFSGVAVDAVLAESQLSTQQKSWINEEHFSLLMRTRSRSAFTLRRIADGVTDPLLVQSNEEQLAEVTPHSHAEP